MLVRNVGHLMTNPAIHLADGSEIPEGIMPMSISWLGNSSVATVPTLVDLVARGEMNGQKVSPGDAVILASVAAAPARDGTGAPTTTQGIVPLEKMERELVSRAMAATSTLAMANANPQNVLALLR